MYCVSSSRNLPSIIDRLLIATMYKKILFIKWSTPVIMSLNCRSGFSTDSVIGFPAAAVVSAPTPSSAFPPPPPKDATPVNVNPSTTRETTGHVSVIASYRLTEGTPGPLARFIAQGPPPGIPTDSALKALPFPMATAPRSPKIGVLREVHPCGGLVIDFPGEDSVSSDDNDEE
uniref:Uncharacterized protein n=1 Tax=Romanomermis culicivorax TaxID=13658 RepID=A0A915IBY3_ROMCU